MEKSALDRYKERLSKALDLELEAQQSQLKDAYQSISKLKHSGYGIFPIRITNQTFGVGEYPEITFKVPLSQSTDLFRNQSIIELFSENNSVKAALIYLHPTDGKICLFSDDFPEWLEESVGIRVGIDEKSIRLSKEAIEAIDTTNQFAKFLFEDKPLIPTNTNFVFTKNDNLNESQNKAVEDILGNSPISILHGPPGTGKTTTIVEAIRQLTDQNAKILAVAPSNMAVDHLANSLLEKGINVLRVGNPAKVSEKLLAHTVEGKLSTGETFKELKKMRIQAEEFRRMASQYKRNFGKEERQQRQLIWKHYKDLKAEIRQTIDYYKTKWREEAQVICGTPISLSDEAKLDDYQIVVIDEAGQCLQPFGWLVMPSNIKKIVLAGDHLQLPPTVISEDAAKLGLSESFLELFVKKSKTHLLDTQYRMKTQIAGFSNEYFYASQLRSAPNLHDNNSHLFFYDTAGTGFEEEKEQEGSSYFNTGELSMIPKIIEQLNLEIDKIAFISPYSGQVAKAKEFVLNFSRISTIDSFQGQEFDTIIISLVRSNDKQEIGFLRDYRRMNVAMTRAQNRLIIIGDSATIGEDSFFRQFLDYIERNDAYHTAWELE